MTGTVVGRRQHGAVAILTLDRPAAHNALSAELVQQLTEHLSAESDDDTVGAVVLTGSATAFCVGADISEIPRMLGAAATDPLPFDRLFDAITTSPKPVVAAVRGLALGGGCELLLACDTAVAGTGAQFGLPEVRLGVIPGAGGTQRLVHAIGKAKAMRLLLTGAPVDAGYAYDAGLVAELVPDDEVLSRAVELAEQIAANAPRAVALAADAARAAHDTPLRQGIAHERRNFLLALATSDAQEGVAAFTERRRPTFTGR
ncbi:enoyl-CoA hydratase-related protein [Klenkia sp. PcliD-1-E]|uniref:enoyl-CoA hydratase-related protein n=1 Tax=Klenkia sp. PcliD-1-E TaxID=2954492 RepID=UPI00209857AF|nr:enoyl-CoA hydratase-related protein [Klenkia sp. PcliD-1-E]MCO7218543.1 enoyl-CoA hydratase-related protein [Klenkia sp. PcliD-1-E]